MNKPHSVVILSLLLSFATACGDAAPTEPTSTESAKQLDESSDYSWSDSPYQGEYENPGTGTTGDYERYTPAANTNGQWRCWERCQSAGGSDCSRCAEL